MSRGRGLLPRGAPWGGGLASWTGSGPGEPAPRAVLQKPPRCRGPGLSPAERPQRGCDSVGSPWGRRACWPACAPGSGSVTAWGPLGGGGPAVLRVPQVPFMSLYFNPRSSFLGHCHTPCPVDWTFPETAAGHGWSLASSHFPPETGWTEPGQLPAGCLGVLGTGPRPSVPARPPCALLAQRQRGALPKRAGSGSPCPGHGPVCMRAAEETTPPPEMLAGAADLASPAAILGVPASAGHVTVDTVVGTGDAGSHAASCPLVFGPERVSGSALLTRWRGHRNPRT